MAQQNPIRDYNYYVNLLLPLFKMTQVDLLELACTLLRAGGDEDEGWDSLEESREMLADLIQLNKLDLPEEYFLHGDKTHWRLHLISYIHLTEMSAPYHVLANLFRIRSKERYSRTPFRYFENASNKKRIHISQHKKSKSSQTAPQNKIAEIQMLALKAGLGSLGKAFDDFYFAPLRHAIAHSDYVLHDTELHMVNQRIPDDKNPKMMTSIISYERLGEIIARCYDFYTAFFTLDSLARSEFARIAGQAFPYEKKLKGLLEFLTNEQALLSGFKIHWPNKTDSTYQRLVSGCESLHIGTDPDGTLKFFPGKLAKAPHAFSPLISKGEVPCYSPLAHQSQSPSWPE